MRKYQRKRKRNLEASQAKTANEINTKTRIHKKKKIDASGIINLQTKKLEYQKYTQ